MDASPTKVYDDGTGSVPLVGLGATTTTLYWLEACSGLDSAALPTGAFKTVAPYSCNAVDMNQAALDPAGKYMYYSDAVDGEIVQITLASGDQNIVASHVASPSAVAADDKYVSWTDSGTCTGSAPDGTCKGGKVMRALPAGTSATALVDDIDSGGVDKLAVDAQAVYYTALQSGTPTLYERKLAGGAPFALGTGASWAVPGGSYVYHAVGGSGVVRVAR